MIELYGYMVVPDTHFQISKHPLMHLGLSAHLLMGQEEV